MPYKSRRLMFQTVSIQRLALLDRPKLNPDIGEEVLNCPAVYQEVQDEFVINYYKVASMTQTITGAVARCVKILVGTSCVPVVNLYHLGFPAGTVLPKRCGSRRKNDNKSVRSDVTHKAKTNMLNVNYEAESRMDIMIIKTKMYSVPTSLSRGRATIAPSGRLPSRPGSATPLQKKP